MPSENILVIAVDGLRAAALGAYGNTSFGTPALDALAAESFLFDECFADAIELSAIYGSLWKAPGASLPQLLKPRGYTTSLVTDEATVAQLAELAVFDEVVQLADETPSRAEAVSETSLAAFFAAAGDEIQSSGSGRLVWLHSRGMYGPWDAPLDLQEALFERDEGDPPPSDVLEPPDLALDNSRDPDTVFRWSCAYAAQAIVLDDCIEALLGAVVESSHQWLVVLLGVRGFPLGEHGRIGGVDERLYAEQLHVPLLWRFPDSTGRLARTGQLVSHYDVLPTLLDWMDGSGTQPSGSTATSLLPLARSCDPQPPRELVATSRITRVIRTADWTLRAEIGEPDESHVELFVRPDDRWEANDVAIRCPDVVDELAGRLAEITASTSAASTPS